jgi:hypothetical protein
LEPAVLFKGPYIACNLNEVIGGKLLSDKGPEAISFDFEMVRSVVVSYLPAPARGRPSRDASAFLEEGDIRIGISEHVRGGQAAEAGPDDGERHSK